ncbi:MAG: glutamine--fructose-6-phosphate aminotransferase, partial [Actinomycetales bacterium]|nr:glutamine--fructose-6-phosphate aminotransferase [Actinomycetales bacterium]
MCGIVGYVGDLAAGSKPLEVVLEGLRRLEYRGYDSAGVALVGAGAGGVATSKKAGKLANLVTELETRPLPGATAAIGHTRWATHGAPNDVNAHPHTAGKVAVIHNGIVENFAQLKAEVAADGAEFSSETDTEVVAHLLDRAFAETGDLAAALTVVARRLEGTFTILAVHGDDPRTVVGARHDSPLVVGLGEGENFLGSDVAAFIAHTREALELGQDQVVTITPDSVTVTDFDGAPVEPRRFTVDWDAAAAEKGGYSSFMDKEIHDQPHAVADTLLGRTDLSGAL